MRPDRRNVKGLGKDIVRLQGVRAKDKGIVRPLESATPRPVPVFWVTRCGSGRSWLPW